MNSADDQLMQQLRDFYSKSAKNTYAAGADHENVPERNAHKEIIYKEGDWFYRDSYSGYFRSWGQEVISYQNKPIWTQIYGGGVINEYVGDEEFANRTFSFLMKAIGAKEEGKFYPRGPKQFSDGEWKYSANWTGNIDKFRGSEEISYQGVVVFTHDFIGGLFLDNE